MEESKLGSQEIGAAGELLIQYHLIKRGIDSARLTTDSGIDLVMYVPGATAAHTVQVKATNTHYPYGPGTPPQLFWLFPVTCKAEWLAVVDLPRDQAWLFPTPEAVHIASPDRQGTATLAWYLEDNPRRRKFGYEPEFDQYRLPTVIQRLLGGAIPRLP
jgi:hypothetical protein